MKAYLKLTSILFLLCLISFFSCKKNEDPKPVVVIVDTTKKDTIAPIRPVTLKSNAYVTDLFAYVPAPGQFINTENLGDTASARQILKNNEHLVTLGAFGGYIVLGFDHTVLNVEAKEDFIVYGNAFSSFAEPGVVWVMEDKNGNGKPDDTWYEIKGSAAYKDGYVRNYSITYTRPASDDDDVAWKDNLGKSGFVKKNMFHDQPYYPAWLNNEYTLTGTLLPHSNINDSDPTYITSGSFDYGYADNTADGDKIDIDDAINKKGDRVQLKGIDFIKIQTGILYDMGWLGELSTEVTGAADLSLVK